MGPATVNQEDLLEEAGARVEAETGLEKVRGPGGTGREYWRGPAASMGAELIREVGDTHNGGGGAKTGLRCILQCTCLQCGSEAGDAALLE